MLEKYFHEREKLSMIKTAKGFIGYRVEFPHCHIGMVFVEKEFRQDGHGKFLLDQVFDICKGAGIQYVFCYPEKTHNNFEIKNYKLIKALAENYGFEFMSEFNGADIYRMEVV